MNQKMITDAYCRIRTIDSTIPDDVLDFMKDSALAALKTNSSDKTILHRCKCELGNPVEVKICINCDGILE